ncbi:hypothetical protein N9W21_03235 [Shewanella sp.]|nr:hypothetical protein [Shewanella sp.]
MVTVFIGPFRFDVALRQLVNTHSAQVLQLSPVEFLVINELILSRGRVVSTQWMRHLTPEQPLSVQEITIAVNQIKIFLGSKHASMIETVSSQGYLLHLKPRKFKIHNSPYKALSVKLVALLMMLSLMFVIFLATHFNASLHHYLPLPDQIAIKDQSVLLPIYHSETERQRLEQRLTAVAGQLALCETLKWHKIYVAVSPSSPTEQLQFVMQANHHQIISDRKTVVINISELQADMAGTWMTRFGFCE